MELSSCRERERDSLLLRRWVLRASLLVLDVRRAGLIGSGVAVGGWKEDGGGEGGKGKRRGQEEGWDARAAMREKESVPEVFTSLVGLHRKGDERKNVKKVNVEVKKEGKGGTPRQGGVDRGERAATRLLFFRTNPRKENFSADG